jgi:DNA-binding CsgD family transcriptional regulator
MKGGVISGNIMDAFLPTSCGGGVFIAGFGIFTMEGGVIMNNTARSCGGGFHTESRGTFRKTGGTIYGSNAPAGLRNIALEGNPVVVTTPRTKGHAVCVALADYSFYFRNDTLNKNDNISYTGAFQGNGIFGEGDKWDNSRSAFRRLALIVIILVLAVGIVIFFIIKKFLKKRLEAVLSVARAAPETDFSGFNLTDREKEVCTLLLTDLDFKEIAAAIGVTNRTVSFHAQNLYRKLGIQSRTELYVKLRRT